MTKDDLEKIIQQAYWQGFKDAGKLLLDTVGNKAMEDQPTNKSDDGK